jgi:hypothetical protein
VSGKLRVSFYRRKPARSSSFIREGIRITDTEREVGIMIEEE